MKNTYNFDIRLVWNEVYKEQQEQGLAIDEHFCAYFGKPQDLSLPQLPPPKRFLRAGSVYWVSPDVRYSFIEDTRVPFSSLVDVKKYHNVGNKTLRLLKVGYFFIRDKDCLSESKKAFRSIVYNVDKKALYIIQAVPKYKTTKKGKLAKKQHWAKSISRVSLNSNTFGMTLGYFVPEHVKRFINDLKNIVSKDVPDVCDICKMDSNRVIALILQHRIGRGIPNLNDTFIENLGMMAQHQFVSARHGVICENEGVNTVSNTIEAHDKAIKKLKRNSVYKFIPVLKETSSIKKALQVMLGECYVSILPKILFDINWMEISMQENTLIKYKENVPKSLQHYVMHALKELPADEFKNLFTNILNLSQAHHVEDYIKESWIRVLRRLKVIIPWNIWKDTYSMAHDLGIRIRPNRFGSIGDIMTLHDNFSRIIRRNRNITNTGLIIDKNSKFVDVGFPEEFEGFKFKQLLTPQELLEETDIMGHCVHTYDRNCVRGDSIIFSAIGQDGRRWTVEYSGSDYTLVQAEGRQSDNGGRRFYCPSEIKQAIFVPFSNVIKRLYTHKLPYKMRCSLNVGIIAAREKAYALSDIIDSNLEGADTETTTTELSLCNCLLEDLIEFDREVKTNKFTNSNAITCANILLDCIEGTIKVVNAERPIHREVRRAILPGIAQETQGPEQLFPIIPDQLIREIQAADGPFDF